MKRRKSLMIIAILLWGLFFISGCGDGVPSGTLNTNGATVALISDAPATGLSALQSCILTATLMDKSKTSVPLSGQVIAFSFVSNQSGATLTPMNGGITDSLGKAYAVYTAGSLQPGLNILDTVQANIKDFSGVVTITRKGGGGSTAGFQISITATPPSVKAGDMSIVVANVKNADGQLVSGQTVSFTIATNNSGATLTALSGGVTDAAGNAMAQYIAGNNSEGLNIQDTIQASITGSTAAVVISRTSAMETGNRITLTSTALADNITWQVTAEVKRNDNTTPAAGESVVFDIVMGTGTVDPTPVVTNNSGVATTYFKRPAAAGTSMVRARIPATVNGGEAVTVITYSGAAAQTYTIAVTASPSALTTTDGNSTITANVKNSAGAAVSGVTVSFAVTGNNQGTVSPATAITDSNGNAVTVYTGKGGVVPLKSTNAVTASVTDRGSTYSASTIITYP